MFGRRRKPIRAEEDPTGLASAVRDFNDHVGPARIFFNRHARTFYTKCYEPGADSWWGPMCDGMDSVELYRKTTAMPDVKVTEHELELMEQEIGPYSVW